MRRLHSRQRSGVASQQRLRPRRFDSTVKRVPKLRFEPVSFLFLACFWIKVTTSVGHMGVFYRWRPINIMETRNFETSFNLQRVRQDSGLMKLFVVSQRLFQPIEFSLFRSLIGWIQAIKLRKSENSIGWKRFGSFISLHLAYRRKSVCFNSFYEAKHFFFFCFFNKKKNAQNQRAKLIFWKWVKLLLYNFGLFQQVFENLKLNKLVKEERRLDLEDRIWRLKFGKTQFWSCILKNEFESLYFWKASFHFFGVW